MCVEREGVRRCWTDTAGKSRRDRPHKYHVEYGLSWCRNKLRGSLLKDETLVPLSWWGRDVDRFSGTIRRLDTGECDGYKERQREPEPATSDHVHLHYVFPEAQFVSYGRNL